MRWFARLATRRPGPILAVWALVFVVAALSAGSARRHIHQTDLQIPGTQAARAAALTTHAFGGTISTAILLKGPPAVLAARGPRIVRALERIDGVEVLSPFVPGTRVPSQPRGQALLSLQVTRPFQQISDVTTPAIERTLAREVHAPLRVEVTGLAPLVRAINQTSLDSLDKGELIALPVLFLLLLAIFRSPLAALVPALSGLLVTRIGTALMGVLAQHVKVDALALNMVAMMGLALGVDYSLLVVSRFREELANGRSVADAVEEVSARAGRTVIFAGSALATGMLGALVIAPGALLVSATMGLIVAAVMAVLVALFAMPAGLALLGTSVNRWQFGGARGASPWVAIAERALRKPGVAAFFVLLPLLVLSAPAIGLKTGPPNVANLPPHNAARASYEAFIRDQGAGWAAPYEIDFQTPGPITTGARLRALQRFQEHLSRLGGVEAVLGPASLQQSSAALRTITRQALRNGAPLAQLENGLRSADDGTGALRDGLAAGASGAQQLVQGLDQAAQGSGQIASGAKQAAPRTRQLAHGIALTGAGSRKLTNGLQRTAPGIRKLLTNLDALQSSLGDEDRHTGPRLFDPLNGAQSDAQAALRQLGSVAPSAAADPNVQRAKQSLAKSLTELGTLGTNLSNSATTLDANATASTQLFKGTRRLAKALTKITGGSAKLDGGIAQTTTGARKLSQGVGQLSTGTAALAAGIRTLLDGNGNGGARALAAGLDQAVSGTTQLGRGVQTILANVVAVRQTANRQQAQLTRNGTDVQAAVNSGYFVLAGLEGAQPQQQSNVSFVTNLARGGNTARVIVVLRTGPFDPASAALRTALQHETDTTAHALGGQGIVGGPAVLLDDFNQATSARFPALVFVLVLVTFLVLLLVFRLPVLALCAVILNLVTAGAAVGVLVICFQGSSPLLGGPGYLDAIALSGLFAVIFGLSIDYEVFLIIRLLEGRELTGTTEGAIRYGLEKTATIITGAAFIMAGVFLSFAVSPVTNVRQLGIGLSVAVLIDATVVRLILLPALIRLFGERTWHTPAWLDRILPRISMH